MVSVFYYLFLFYTKSRAERDFGQATMAVRERLENVSSKWTKYSTTNGRFGQLWSATLISSSRKWVINQSYYQRRGKGKVHQRTGHKGPEGEQSYSTTLSLTSALDGGWWSTPHAGHLTPGNTPGTHCTGGWVGPTAGVDGRGKSSPPQGFDPRNVQPVANRYTDYAIPAQATLLRKYKN
jgi:hypothetical protein